MDTLLDVATKQTRCTVSVSFLVCQQRTVVWKFGDSHAIQLLGTPKGGGRTSPDEANMEAKFAFKYAESGTKLLRSFGSTVDIAIDNTKKA